MPQDAQKRSLSRSSAIGSLEGWLPRHSFLMSRKNKPTVTATTHPAVSEPVASIPVVSTPASTTSTSSSHIYSSLEQIHADLAGCTRCKLCTGRKTIVLGEGNAHPELMFVGEGPGQSEDEQGRPFVGASGQLLDKMINAMGVNRSDVFIANVVKCRPPNNRTPEPDEVATCLPFLLAQIRVLKPKVIVGLGATAVKSLMHTDETIGKLRGKTFQIEGATLIPSFHPSYLLRTPAAKKDAWEDLKMAMNILGWTGKSK